MEPYPNHTVTYIYNGVHDPAEWMVSLVYRVEQNSGGRRMMIRAYRCTVITQLFVLMIIIMIIVIIVSRTVRLPS